jgi:hypothetical protein
VTAAVEEARCALWEWASQIAGADDRQIAWRRAYLDGMIDACEALALLSPDELAGWRALSGGARPAAALGDGAASERHLAALRRELRPLGREPTEAGRAASDRYFGALEALHAAGLLDESTAREWHAAAYEVTAPWLDAAEIERVTSLRGAVAIPVPPATPEEERDDERAREQAEAVGRVGELRRVLVPAAVDVIDGLAIVAVLDREESLEVVFHAVGLGCDLAPATVADDRGTRYEPAFDRPVNAHSAGGPALTGHWRYQPAAAGARSFTIAWRDHTWRV